MTSIAIIDVIGLTYDGNTLSRRGLGGSESAIILISKELQKLGFSVTVLNNCIDKEACEGIYDGVEYVDISRVFNGSFDKAFDIVISSRTITPFVTEKYWNQYSPDPKPFQKIKNSAKLKILWLHDTFCSGDELLEEHVVNGDIDEIFTLSDFHTSYITNCDHGNKRNFEVLKNKIFMTRNGAVKYIDEVDISNKDRNLFVYNASVTKGMIPLVEQIWPRIKQNVTEARLKVIGGYYRFRENAAPDEQEKKWWDLVSNPLYSELGIEFTGIIKQQEIANILASASFMIYPTVFPETFGISSLESILYNTPLITCRFGALEETAFEQACYLQDYPVEPNGLFPNISSHDQQNKFVDMVLRAYNDPYLHQQKMYACNQVKDISGWNTVALQWKQHFFKKLNLFLTVDEYRKVSNINYRVQKIFGRKFHNNVELYYPRSVEQKISVIVPFFNAQNYIERNIQSIAQQDYDSYHVFLIDDCSTDNSFNKATQAVSKLPQSIQNKFSILKNTTNLGAVCNQVTAISQCEDNDIIMLVDGDDWLINDNNIFHMFNNLYDGSTEFTYGSCWSLVDNIPLIAQPYPNHVKQTKEYRKHRFNWNIPYTHLRTFKKYLINQVSNSELKDENGYWYKAGGDGALFYSLIERAVPEKVKAISDIVYVYNDSSPINDYKVNGEIQTKNSQEILIKDVQRNEIKSETKMKTVLIAIPTAKNIEVETFKSIYDLTVPEGYKTEFQYFYGYNIDQIRNLIAHWVVNGNYDYLLSIDSDIVLPQDTLVKMIKHDRDIVSGVYIQRIHGTQIPELYRFNAIGGMQNLLIDDLSGNKLIEIDGCGFGCALIKKHVFTSIEYPHFVYHSAINHKDTISEDVDFCRKAREKGFKLFADTSIVCRHIGSHHFVPTIPN